MSILHLNMVDLDRIIIVRIFNIVHVQNSHFIEFNTCLFVSIYFNVFVVLRLSPYNPVLKGIRKLVKSLFNRGAEVNLKTSEIFRIFRRTPLLFNVQIFFMPNARVQTT